MSIDRIDPPFAADETAMLRSFLTYFRQTVRRQVSGLTIDQLREAVPPSAMTLAGMLRHLAFVEDYWFQVVLADAPPAEPWASVDWRADPDWDWHDVDDWAPADLDAALVASIAASDARLDATLAIDPDLAQPAARRRGPDDAASLRWILVHMIEEYARHCGHADLLRESLDGATDL